MVIQGVNFLSWKIGTQSSLGFHEENYQKGGERYGMAAKNRSGSHGG